MLQTKYGLLILLVCCLTGIECLDGDLTLCADGETICLNDGACVRRPDFPETFSCDCTESGGEEASCQLKVTDVCEMSSGYHLRGTPGERGLRLCVNGGRCLNRRDRNSPSCDCRLAHMPSSGTHCEIALERYLEDESSEPSVDGSVYSSEEPSEPQTNPPTVQDTPGATPGTTPGATPAITYEATPEESSPNLSEMPSVTSIPTGTAIPTITAIPTFTGTDEPRDQSPGATNDDTGEPTEFDDDGEPPVMAPVPTPTIRPVAPPRQPSPTVPSSATTSDSDELAKGAKMGIAFLLIAATFFGCICFGRGRSRKSRKFDSNVTGDLELTTNSYHDDEGNWPEPGHGLNRNNRLT